MKRVKGGILVQTDDYVKVGPETLKVVTKRAPTEAEVSSMLFAWKVVKHVWSNAIILAKGEQVVGIGAGQMSRVDSSMIAGHKAGEKAQGSVMASDAFFPFRDGVDEAANNGVTAIIQPGGSIRDEEVIKAADEHGMAMVFTGVRVFRPLTALAETQRWRHRTLVQRSVSYIGSLKGSHLHIQAVQLYRRTCGASPTPEK